MKYRIDKSRNERNFFNIILLFIKSIERIGILNLVLIIYYEFIFLFIGNYKDLFFKEESSKIKKKKFDQYYIPTPYYYLKIISDQIRKLKIEHCTLIDFGCGKCRVINFFNNDFKNIVGIDIKAYYKNFLISKKQKYINLNLRDLKKTKKLNNFLKKDRVLFFYEPFDINLTKKLIKIFLKGKCLVITINIKKIKNKKLKVFYSKKFKHSNPDIFIYKNF